jgi:hypothetical protein
MPFARGFGSGVGANLMHHSFAPGRIHDAKITIIKVLTQAIMFKGGVLCMLNTKFHVVSFYLFINANYECITRPQAKQ